MNASQGVRLTLIVLSAVVLCFMLIRTVRVIRKMTFGQVIYMLASYCTLWYCMDAAREAYVLGIGWRWRLVAYIVAIILYSLYILMPESIHQSMFQGTSWLKRHDADHHEKIVRRVQKYGPGGHVWYGKSDEVRPVPKPPEPSRTRDGEPPA